MSESYGERVQERLRMLQVYDTTLRYGADIAIDRGGALGTFRRWMQARLYRPGVPLPPLSVPTRVRLMLQDLGPTYVKVGQLVSSQARVLPDEWERELARLQSDVRPFPVEDARRVIQEELGAPPERVFAEFDAVPLAAASLAQVHRAVLHDGRPVAVKVRRPNIERQLRADIGIMRRMAGVAERRAEWARQVGLSGVIDTFGHSLLRELDYRIEAHNARRLAANLADIEGVHIPEVIREHSARRVLTLEFIDGVPASERDAIVAAGLDPVAIGDAGVRAAIKMLLIDGFFHADPHPGNVLVNLGTGELTFIDTGMVGELTVGQRMKLVNLLTTLQGGDLMALGQALRGISSPYRHTDERAFDREFERTIAPILDVAPGQPLPMADVLSSAFGVLRDHGFRVDPDLSLAIKALTQAEAFTSVLYPPGSSASFAPKAATMARELLDERLTAQRLGEYAKRQATYAVREAAQQLPPLDELAKTWFRVLRKGQVSVKLDLSDLDERLDRAEDISRLVTVGVLVAGVMVGGGVAATVSPGGSLGWLRDVALVGFTAALVVAAVLVLSLVRRYAQGQAARRRR